MKNGMIFISTVVCLLILSGCSQKVMLFNGRNLDGWQPVLKDPAVDPQTVWSVRDGVIHCLGQPNGYIRTTESYADYKLHVEWRWTDNPTNSGVLLHMTGPDQVWPRSVEAQLQSGNAGDIILIGQGLTITARGKQINDPDKKFQFVKKRTDSSENPPGQWNTYDILCKGDTVRLVVNGVLQNEASDSVLTAGPICLQSEGSPIEFRNVWLKKLP